MNNLNLGMLYHFYDAIMLPPDEGSKKTGIWNKIKSFVTSHGSEDMLQKHKNLTFQIMFSVFKRYIESCDEKTIRIDSIQYYLHSILINLTKSFLKSTHNYIHNSNNLEKVMIIEILK